MNNEDLHVSVFLQDAIKALQIKSNGIYVDCTLGRGGHAKAILEQLTTGELIAIDCDDDAIKYAKTMFTQPHIQIYHSRFSKLNEILGEAKITAADGFLFDLGLSSPQLDNKERGFSYHGDDNLDMRMDQTQTLDAKVVVNTYSEEQLIKIFQDYGECKHAHFVARKILKTRVLQPITTTSELVEVIKHALPNQELHKHKHPARTYFQAIRIEVNHEFQEIDTGLNTAIKHLKNSGRVVVITFHSLEDNLVRKIFKQYTTTKLPAYLPIKAEQSEVAYKVIKVKLDLAAETNQNTRARSARMHIIERSL